MMKKQITYPLRAIIIAICLIGFFTVSPGISADMRDSESYLKQTILTLHKARNGVIERHYLEPGSETRAAQEDLRIFIGYLDGRIYHSCQTLLSNGGPDSLKDLPCPSSARGNLEVNQFDSVPEITGQTSGEKVTGLDQKLDDVLGEFDEILLKEQETIATHIPRQRESGSSLYDRETGNGLVRDGDYQQTAVNTHEGRTGKNSPVDSTTRKSGRNTNEAATNQGGGNTKTSQSRLPPTRGPKDLSEADDDIVAQQLREAAEQETDPEIKEKLWEEYRKYKEGVK